jgi:5-methylcytosine-specific restriction protein B
MARHAEHNTGRIYLVAEAFRANCLLRDGFLLFEDSPVWRLDILDQIDKAFLAIPDEGAQSFIVKVTHRVGRAGREALTLCAPTAI